MRSLLHFHRLMFLAMFAIGTGVATAQPAAATGVGEAVRKPATAAVEVQKLMSQINGQREKMIADHEALAKQFKDATDEQRKVIMEKMHAQKKEFEAAQSALHKQIRDEQRRQRQSSSSGRR
jgi:Skp family chaperone for outer membrane proteins